MFDKIKLKFGSSPGLPPLAFDLTPMTVFVGPNYSGKSKIISEIKAQCVVGQNVPTDVILDHLSFIDLHGDDANAAIDQVRLAPLAAEGISHGSLVVGKRGIRSAIDESVLRNALAQPREGNHWYIIAQFYSRFETLILDGSNRTTLVNQVDGGDLQLASETSIQELFRNDILRAKLSKIVFQAFGTYLVVDPTRLGILRLRLSKIPPPSPAIERGLDEASVQFHAQATDIALASDGAKAFIGILMELLIGDPRMLLARLWPILRGVGWRSG